MAVSELRARIERHIREHELIPPGGEVVALVSGGADSTCLWHALGALGYRVTSLHVNHGLRGDESDEDARFCREALGAEVVVGRGGSTEDELRQIVDEAAKFAEESPHPEMSELYTDALAEKYPLEK